MWVWLHSLQNKIWNLPDRSTILRKFIYDKEGKLAKSCRTNPNFAGQCPRSGTYFEDWLHMAHAPNLITGYKCWQEDLVFLWNFYRSLCMITVADFFHPSPILFQSPDICLRCLDFLWFSEKNPYWFLFSFIIIEFDMHVFFLHFDAKMHVEMGFCSSFGGLLLLRGGMTPMPP